MNTEFMEMDLEYTSRMMLKYRKQRTTWAITAAVVALAVGVAVGLGIALYLEMQVLMIDVIQYPANTVWA